MGVLVDGCCLCLRRPLVLATADYELYVSHVVADLIVAPTLRRGGVAWFASEPALRLMGTMGCARSTARSRAETSMPR